MASEGEACCESDPNFAVICAFLEKFGPTCGISNVDFLLLQDMLENTHEVSPELIDLHIKLLRKARKSVSSERWERAIIKVCHTFCSKDAWEMERFGYKKARLSSKIRILKELLEMQFDYNPKFKTEINKMTAEELRSQPIGRDKMGHAYWFQCDENCQVRVYKEDPDEETWTLVAKDREGLVSLISQLNSGDTVKLDLEPVVNEDSNSTEVEKPIVDTGQVIDSDSKKEETDSSNEPEIRNEDSSDDVIPKKDADEDSTNESEIKQNDEEEDGSLHESESEQKEESDAEEEKKEEMKPEIASVTKNSKTPEENSESALNLSQKKPLLRIKSITELMSQPVTVNDAYSRGESTAEPRVPPVKVHLYSSPMLPRKAVHSAGYEVDSGFKRYSDDDYVENVENLKKPRLNRPVLLTSKKSPYGEEEEVDEEIEEPVMTITGEGSGFDNESCEVGEAIEEPVMYVFGEGNGRDCDTGNEKPNQSDCDKKDSSQGITTGALNDKSDVENSISSCKGDSSLSVSDMPSRPHFKLGTIIDVKSDGCTFPKSPTKKSRWDVGKPIEKDTPTEEPSNEKDGVVKKPVFFFGPGCLQFKPTVTVNSDILAIKTTPATETNSKSPETASASGDDTDACCTITKSEKLNPPQETLNASNVKGETIEEIEKQIVDSSEIAKDVVLPSVVVSIPSSRTEDKSEEVEEEPITKKTTYECGDDNEKEKESESSSVDADSFGHKNEEPASVERRLDDNNRKDEESDCVGHKKEEAASLECTLDDNNRKEEESDCVGHKNEETASLECRLGDNNRKEEESACVGHKNEEAASLECRLDDDNRKEEKSDGVGHKKKESASLECRLADDNRKEEKSDCVGHKNEETASLECRLDDNNSKEDESDCIGHKNEEAAPLECRLDGDNRKEDGVGHKKKESASLECRLADDNRKEEKSDGVSHRKEEAASLEYRLADDNREEEKSDDVGHKKEEVASLECRLADDNKKEEKSDCVGHKNEETASLECRLAIDNRKEEEESDDSSIGADDIESVADENKEIVNTPASPLVLDIQEDSSSIVCNEGKSKSLESQTILSEDTKSLEDVTPNKINEINIRETAETNVVSVAEAVTVTDAKCDSKILNVHKKDSPGKSLANIIDKMNTANATKMQQSVKENAILVETKPEDVEVPKVSESTKDTSLVNSCGVASSDSHSNLDKPEDAAELSEGAGKIVKENKVLKEKETLSDSVNNQITKSDMGEEKLNSIKLIENNVVDTTETVESEKELAKINEPEETADPDNKNDPPQVSVQNAVAVETSKLEETTQTPVVAERRVTRASKNKPAITVEPRKKIIRNKKSEADIETEPHKVDNKSDDLNVPSEIGSSAENDKPVISCVDIKDLIDKNVIESPLNDDDSDSVIAVVDKDPLACTDDETQKKSSAPLTLTSFTLDYDGEPILPVEISKTTRKRSRLSTESKPEEEVAEKRQKLRGKRAVDPELRRSIESQKSHVISSSDDDSGAPDTQLHETEGNEEEKNTEKVVKRGKGKRRRRWFMKKGRASPVPSSDVTSETSRAESVSTPPVKKAGGPRKRKTTLLGLELPADPEMIEEPITGVRQSRRIAQLKIKEEAERRKIEETVLNEMNAEQKKKKSKKYEDKDYKVDTKRKGNDISDDESTVDADIDDKKKKRKRKHKNFRKLFDGSNPWLQNSESSSSNEIEEEEEEDMIDYTEEEPKSDHEFSPESDLEDAGDVQPLKRARTAKKESDVDEVDDCACQKCGKKDHPEWILLCDGCDNGWHCSCLRPALLVIPEGDWFCPPCQHVKLIQNLQTQLKEYDKKLSKKNIEDRRKERLAYVGISLNNVLPAKETEQSKPKQRPVREHSESEEEESGSECSETESSTDSDDEPIYRLRERRQAHSYRFNDYDELINSAIQDEMEAVKGAGNQGRGKDISTIVNAEKEEEAQKAKIQNEEVEPLPPVVPKEVEVNENHEESEEEIRPVKKLIGRKKPRKLNSLDISSGDDHYSDEDFKGTTSTEDEDEEDLDDVVTDSSGSSRYGRKNGPVRRSTRARIARYDREFINDDSDEDAAPLRKKTRSIWDESESEEDSDGSWGGRRRRRKKAGGTRSRQSSSKRKRSKKKKKPNDDSDSDAFKRKRKPKVKYGRIGSDNEDLGIRTRGKKINYLDVLGSDSDDDVPRKVASKAVESEEEYVVNEEDVLEEERDEFENEKESSDDDDSEDDDDDKPPRIKKKGKEPKSSPSIMDKLHMTPVVQLEKTQLTEIRSVSELEGGLNPIEEINRNIEEMSEKDMEKLMEEESYANKQLALVALQIEKEKRRKEQEARNLEVLLQHSQKTSNKRSRRDASELPVDLVMGDYQNNAELSEPPGVTLPIFGDLPPINNSPEEAPKKRKGRGKGKKTLAAEAAAKQAAENQTASVPPITNAATSPMHNAKLSVAAPPQPFAQSQPAPSVITRMLQSQPYPVSTSGTYFPAEPQHPADMVQAGAGQYMQGGNPRIPVTSPYRQGPPPPQQPPVNMGHYQMRPGIPAMPPQQQQQRNPNQSHPPHIYQHSHRPMDPSPSGGGPITMPQERNSPALIPAPADSPLSNKSESTPPPPPYNRPSMLRYPPNSNGTPMGATGSLPPPPRHMQMIQGHVVPPRPNTMSPYPPPPPNMPPSYYGTYGPPPPLVGGEEALPPPAAYQTPPYPDHYGTDGPGLAISESSNSKGFDDESGGEFGGLVSYFSSQREDDLDT